jgi:hypothetical protein
VQAKVFTFLASGFRCLFFFIVTISFKPMASAHDGCSYHQAKTSIGF